MRNRPNLDLALAGLSFEINGVVNRDHRQNRLWKIFYFTGVV